MTERMANLFNLIYSFRGLITWLMVFSVGIFFTIDKTLNGAQFVSLINTTFIAFAAMHASEHITTTVKEYLNATGQVVKTEVEPEEGDDIIKEKASASKT
jgi:hypothetical protein